MAVNVSALRELALDNAADELIAQREAGFALSDYPKAFLQGVTGLGEAAGYGIKAVGEATGLESAVLGGARLQDTSRRGTEALGQAMSVGGQFENQMAAEGQSILESRHPIQRALAGITQSAVPTAVGFLPGLGVFAKASQAGLAAKTAARLGVMAGSLSEGLLGGLQAGAQDEHAVASLPDEELDQVPAFQAALARVSPDLPEESRRQLAREQAAKDVGISAFFGTGLTTMAASAVVGAAGGGILGSLLQRGKAPVGRAVATGVLGEAAEEATQGVSEQVVHNLNLGRPVTEGLSQAAIDSAIIGGVMGGAFSGVRQAGQNAAIQAQEDLFAQQAAEQQAAVEQQVAQEAALDEALADRFGQSVPSSAPPVGARVGEGAEEPPGRYQDVAADLAAARQAASDQAEQTYAREELVRTLDAVVGQRGVATPETIAPFERFAERSALIEQEAPALNALRVTRNLSERRLAENADLLESTVQPQGTPSDTTLAAFVEEQARLAREAREQRDSSEGTSQGPSQGPSEGPSQGPSQGAAQEEPTVPKGFGIPKVFVGKTRAQAETLLNETRKGGKEWSPGTRAALKKWFDTLDAAGASGTTAGATEETVRRPEATASTAAAAATAVDAFNLRFRTPAGQAKTMASPPQSVAELVDLLTGISVAERTELAAFSTKNVITNNEYVQALQNLLVDFNKEAQKTPQLLEESLFRLNALRGRARNAHKGLKQHAPASLITRLYDKPFKALADHAEVLMRVESIEAKPNDPPANYDEAVDAEPVVTPDKNLDPETGMQNAAAWEALRDQPVTQIAMLRVGGGQWLESNARLLLNQVLQAIGATAYHNGLTTYNLGGGWVGIRAQSEIPTAVWRSLATAVGTNPNFRIPLKEGGWATYRNVTMSRGIGKTEKQARTALVVDAADHDFNVQPENYTVARPDVPTRVTAPNYVQDDEGHIAQYHDYRKLLLNAGMSLVETKQFLADHYDTYTGYDGEAVAEVVQVHLEAKARDAARQVKQQNNAAAERVKAILRELQDEGFSQDLEDLETSPKAFDDPVSRRGPGTVQFIPRRSAPDFLVRMATDPQMSEGARTLAQDIIDRVYGEVAHTQRVTDHVTRIRAKWRGRGQISVVAREEDLPERILKPMREVNPEALIYGVYDPRTDTTYIVAQHHSNLAEVEFTLGHEEAGHRAFDRILGVSRKPIMERLFDQEPMIREAAQNYQQQYKYDKARAAEEAMADLAGRGIWLKGFRRVVAAISQGLRRLGLARMAGWIEAKNGTPLALNILTQARAFVRDGRTPHVYTATDQQPLFSFGAPRTNDPLQGMTSIAQDVADGATNVWNQVVGMADKRAVKGSGRAVRNWLHKNLASPIHIARSGASAGFANLHDNVLRPREQFVSYLGVKAMGNMGRDWLAPGRQRNPDVMAASTALKAWNKVRVSRAEFVRTAEYRALSKEGQRLFEQVRTAIRESLMAEFYAEAARAEGAHNSVEEWTETVKQMLAHREQLLDRGYIPNQRFGSWAIGVKANDTGEHVHWQTFETYQEAQAALPLLQAHFANDPAVTVDTEIGTVNRGPGDRHATASFWDMAERMKAAGSPLSAEQLRALAKKMLSSDSLTLNKLLHRKGIAGQSEDLMRVVTGFVQAQAHKTGAILFGGREAAALSEVQQQAVDPARLEALRTEIDKLTAKPEAQPGKRARAGERTKEDARRLAALTSQYETLLGEQARQARLDTLRQSAGYKRFEGMSESQVLDTIRAEHSSPVAAAREYTAVARLRLEQVRGASFWQQDNADKGFYQGEAQRLVQSLRDPQSPGAARLRLTASLMFLGGNISAAAVQVLGAGIFTTPYLAQYVSASNTTAAGFKAGMKLAKAGREFVENFRLLTDLERLTNPNKADKAVLDRLGLKGEALQFLQRAHQEDILGARVSYDMLGIARGEGTGPVARRWQQAKQAWMFPFVLMEQLNRVSTFRVALDLGKQRGLAGAQLYKFASQAVDETQAVTGAVSRPGWARTPLGQVLFTFKQVPMQMFELALRLPPKYGFMAMGLMVLLAGLRGIPGFEDAEDLVDTVAQRVLKEPFNLDRWLTNFFHQAGEVMGGIPLDKLLMNGAWDSYTGFSIANRVGLGNLVPGTRALLAGEDFWGQTMKDIAGPAGSELENVVQLLRGEGDPHGPLTGYKNLMRGIDAFRTGRLTDRRGNTLIDGMTFSEQVAQTMGFSVERLTEAYHNQRTSLQYKAYPDQVKQGLLDDLRRGFLANDREAVQEVYDNVNAWNTDHPDLPFNFDYKQVRSALADAGLTLNERLVKLIPKAWRGSRVLVPR